MKKTILLSLIAALSGCVSFNETPYPEVTVASLPPGREVSVQVAGFDATITTYVPVLGYTTVMGSGTCYGRHGRHCHVPTMTTIATETYVPQATPTSVFRDRAVETLEKCGFLLQTPAPAYRLEVRFDGPFVADSDTLEEFGWMLFSLFTADYGTQTWTAKLRIHDNKTGKLLFFKDYSQKYEVNVWGPIPLFSPGGASKTKYSAMQSWCLTALTDTALADASDFLTKQTK